MRVANLLIKTALPWLLSLGLAFFAAMTVVSSAGVSFGVHLLFSLVLTALWSGLSSSVRFILRGDVRRGSRQRFVLAFLAGGATLVALTTIVLLRLFAALFVVGEPTRLLLPAALAGAGVYCAHFAYFYAALVEGVVRQAELDSLERELREREMELALVTAKFSPHFLFNSLNSVAALTRKDPSLAYEMCVSLGDYLRESLRTQEGKLSTLRSELKLVSDYLRLEKLRYGERIVIEEEIVLPDDEAFPAFVLQLLAENAVKHGVASMDSPCAISIRVGVAGELVEVCLENRFGGRSPRSSSKVGLGLVRAQIAYFSERAATLSSEAVSGVFRVVIRWPRGAMGRKA